MRSNRACSYLLDRMLILRRLEAVWAVPTLVHEKPGTCFRFELLTSRTSTKEGCKVDFLHNNGVDRKSTRLNSSHTVISYAVFCLKKKIIKKKKKIMYNTQHKNYNIHT